MPHQDVIPPPREIAATTSDDVEFAAAFLAFGAISELDGKPKAAGKTTFILELVRCVLDGSGSSLLRAWRSTTDCLMWSRSLAGELGRSIVWLPLYLLTTRSWRWKPKARTRRVRIARTVEAAA